MSDIYAWIKDVDTNLDECVVDNPFCMRNALGQPVLTCSLNRNKDKPMCADTVKADSAYRVLGCYDTPDCGGRVVAPDDSVTPSPVCSQDICKQPTAENCIELREGIQRPEDTGIYCYLGGKKYNHDPCRLSLVYGGNDFCPRACFHPGCCPGTIHF